MSMFYSPEVLRVLTCERIREARGYCDDGRNFELPIRNVDRLAGLRRLLGRRQSPDTCSC